MSLHDVNKHQLDRSDPQPNHTDRLNDGSIKAHQTTSTTYKTDASAANVRVQQQNSRILAIDSNSIPVADFGLQGDGTIGLKVAQPGIDVTTATNAQLIFNSSQDVFKIVMSGTISLNTVSVSDAGAGLYNSNSVTTTVAHNLGYAPVVIGYINVVTQYIAMPYTILDGAGALATWQSYSISVDQFNIYVTSQVLALHQAKTTIPAQVKYFLLQESAS